MNEYGVLRRGGWHSYADLAAALERAAHVADEQFPDDLRWLRSYVLNEDRGQAGTFCVYEAISPEAIRRHPAHARLPVDEIVAIAGTLIAGTTRTTPMAGGCRSMSPTQHNHKGGAMTLKLGDPAPDFEANTTEGPIRFHEWLGDSWGVLFSHPKDFTPVCTTELGYMARIKPEFDRRGVKIIGLSVDPVQRHLAWASDIEETQGCAPNFPCIGDADYTVSKLYGMLPADVSGDPLARTPADNQTVRNVFVIGPDKKIKLILVYPMTTGRNFDEVLRVVDSLQLTAKHKVATPANWKQGEDVIIAGSVSDEDAKKVYPQGWKAPRPYLRIVPQPR